MEAKSQPMSRNAAFSFVTQALPMLVGIACVPLLIRFLGAERVGLLSMIWVVISYFSVLDIGVGAAITRSVSMTLAGDDHAAIPHIFWSAAILQVVMGATGAILLTVTAPLVAAGLHVPANLLAESVMTIRICAMGLPVVLLSGSVTGLLQAAQQFPLLAKYQVPFSIAQYVCPVLLAASGRRLPAIVACMVAIRLISLGVTFDAARRLFPLLSGAIKVSLQQIRGLLSYGAWVTVSAVVSPILVYVDRFIIANRLGLPAVAYYAIPLDAVMRLLLFSSSITTVLYPVFSGMSATGQSGRANSVAGSSLKYVLGCTGIPTVVLFLLAGDILRQWLGQEFAAQSTTVLRILLAGVLANSLARIPFSMLQSHGYPRITATLHLAALPAQLLATVSLMTWFGLEGAALAWSGRMVLDTALLFYFAHRNCGFSLPQTWAACKPVAYTLLVVFLLGVIGLSVTSPNLNHRVFTAALVSGMGCVLFWFRALSSQDRSVVRTCILRKS